MKNNFKKIIIWISASVITLGALIAVLVVKFTNPFKPAFYAYSSYTDQQTKNQIQKKYTYKEFGSYEEFEYAIGNNKAIAGITSDYSIINLINEGKIAPISKDLAEILGKPIDNLWNYFTDVTNEQMLAYDNLLTIDEVEYAAKYGYPENYDFKFRDFVVPYFINDRVIAFDTKKVLGHTYQAGEEINPLKISSNADLSECLKILKEKNNSIKIQWTKNPIENVVYGSSYLSNGQYNGLDSFSTQINSSNYMEWIDNFATMVQVSTGGSISNNGVNIFDSDSDIILNNLINPSSKIDVAILYNGDALDAYYGHDNFSAIDDGDRLRILRSQNNIRILDAFVVSSSISHEKRKELLSFFNQYMFNNMFVTKSELDAMNPETIYEQDGIMRIFDYVNYTPTAKGAFEYIRENYFILDPVTGKKDDVAIDIFNVVSGKAIMPVKQQLLSDLTLEFQKKLNGK